VIFQENILKVLKCYNFLWVQRRHIWCPVASFANCVMTLHLLKVHLQKFLSLPTNKKCQISSCDTLVANERYKVFRKLYFNNIKVNWCDVIIKISQSSSWYWLPNHWINTLNKQTAYTPWNGRIIWIGRKKGEGQLHEHFRFISQFSFRDKVKPLPLQKLGVGYIIRFLYGL
jgi:hypothetical protein